MTQPANPAAQLALFDLEPEAPAARPAKWIGHRGPWGRNLTWTRDDLPGLVVHHCGHPTASYPYFVKIGGIETEWTYRHLAEAQADAAARWAQAQARHGGAA